jgi:hypothetical protein
MLGSMAELLLRLRDRELSRTLIRNTRLSLGRDPVSKVLRDHFESARLVGPGGNMLGDHQALNGRSAGPQPCNEALGR